MLLALGSLWVDVATRAVVIGRVADVAATGSVAADALASLVGSGADAVEVTAAAAVLPLADQLGVPVVLAAPDPDEALAGLAAGAAAVVVAPGWPPDVLRASRAAGATAFVRHSCVGAAVDAGLGPANVVVDGGSGAGGLVAPAQPCPGHHLGLSFPTGLAAAGPVTLAMAQGHRVFRVTDVRGARRAADVVTAILGALHQ